MEDREARGGDEKVRKSKGVAGSSSLVLRLVVIDVVVGGLGEQGCRVEGDGVRDEEVRRWGDYTERYK